MKYAGMPFGMWTLFAPSFILSMPERPDVERLTEYYAKSMMTKPMKWFCRMSGKSKFTEKDIAGMKATAALRAADRNPCSWNMELYEYPDDSGYEGRFTKCGICVLMKKLGRRQDDEGNLSLP